MTPAASRLPGRRRKFVSPLRPGQAIEQVCFEANDSSVTHLPASFLLRNSQSRDPSSQIARLADQLVKQNLDSLRQLDVNIEPHFRNSSIELDIHTGTRIGAIPLISPTSGRHDYGLVVRPRYDWPGIGPILGATGWRIIPTPLAMDLLPRSERRVPPSGSFNDCVVPTQGTSRPTGAPFQITHAERSSPRGTIAWDQYLHRQISRARFLEVPCRFPELQKERDLRAAIRFALEKQRHSLESQRIGVPSSVNSSNSAGV